MAAPLPTSFRGYVLGTANPNQDAPQAEDTMYRPPVPGAPAPVTAAQCFAMAESRIVPTFFLGNCGNTNKPLPLLAFYSTNTAGRADNNNHQYAFVGDLDMHETMPPIVVITQDGFDVTNVAATVPNLATLQNVWAALPADEDRVQPPADNTDQVFTRHMHPIPYPYVNQILQAHMDHRLSWRYLVTQILQPISLIAAEQDAYSGFVNWVRVSSTSRPDGAAFGPAETAMEFAAVYGLPRALQARRPMLLRYLPGMGRPTDLTQDLRTLVQEHRALQQSIGRMQERPQRPLLTTHPLLTEIILKISESTTEAQLPTIWHQWGLHTKGQHLTAIENACQSIAATRHWSIPIITPALATDIATGHLLAEHNSAFKQGLSPMPGGSTVFSFIIQ
ncbi:expressed unknown protein [Seminavis robusta]|uniref:Uncharacterized protein n=1 Tax=Seminavis robusta TaxID=568900 RepID=A0A9N8F0Z1_9STRA|nr:expressed unknown protein [Seminavis robusta]|eukprot:Sro2429_g327430.1 n/a (391) ;mRNA; f:13375-14626